MRQQLLTFSSIISTVTALKCMQCTGWSWTYPGTQASPCDNQNNQCTADPGNQNMCVRTTDPMRPGSNYETFKLECWTQGSTIQVSPNQPQPVVSGQCYNTQDNGNPPRRQKICFCNNVDWCNGSKQRNILILAFLSASFLYITM